PRGLLVARQRGIGGSRPTPRGPAGRDEAPDGGLEGAARSHERRHISAVDPDRGDRQRARTLVEPDAVPGGRAAGAGHEHCRAFDPAISIGKKNSLFCGNEGGGETWAILASLLNTCKLHGVDPETYLTDVLERMVSGATKNNRLHELLVWNWKSAREAEKAAA